MGDEIERDYLIEKRKLLFDQDKLPEEEINLDYTSSADLPEVFDLTIKIKVLLMQHLGILLGFSVMLIMAMNSDGLIPEWTTGLPFLSFLILIEIESYYFYEIQIKEIKFERFFFSSCVLKLISGWLN